MTDRLSDPSIAGAALTPRPVRLLLILRVEPGREAEVRHQQAAFPIEAAEAAGIGAVEAFVGSGFYALSLEIDVEDTQQALADFLNHPSVRDFHGSLQDVVQGLPSPAAAYGPADDFHGDAAGTAGRGRYASGDLPLAAGMFRWRAGAAAETGMG